MYVYLIHNDQDGSKIRKIGFGRSLKSCGHVMVELLKYYGIMPSYYRYWQEDDGDTWCDYGSWSDFVVFSEKEDLGND